jgi:hypothetical protein
MTLLAMQGAIIAEELRIEELGDLGPWPWSEARFGKRVWW